LGESTVCESKRGIEIVRRKIAFETGNPKELRVEPAGLFREKTPPNDARSPCFAPRWSAAKRQVGGSLFGGFERLKAITYSSGLDIILELTAMFKDVEVTFGSERILSREHAALEQASHIARGYTFTDALADQKAFLERLAAEFGKSTRGLLPRIPDGTLRFRLLRKMPSH
jgi:hypothetical protein